jgi:hypothetical protein
MSHEDSRQEPAWDSVPDPPAEETEIAPVPGPRSETAWSLDATPAPEATSEPPTVRPFEAAPAPATEILERAGGRLHTLPAWPRPRPVDDPSSIDPEDEEVEEVEEEEEEEARASFFEGDAEADQEPFDRPGTEKVGIIGGKGVGKSYLFQAMVYRTYAGNQSGAMTYFLEDGSIRLFSALRRDGRASTVNLASFVRNYESWKRLPATHKSEQKWYRLRLPFRTGWLGTRRSALDLEYFDGSGEGFFEAIRDARNAEVWRQGYLDARVMVFCLPLWAAFPGATLSRDDWDWRDDVIAGFEKVVENYVRVRELGRARRTATILALTMADDSRSALTTLRQRWVEPYLQAPHVHIKQLRRGSGMAVYLGNARKVSLALEDEFASSHDAKVAAIPGRLDFGAGKPWLVPVSALDGGLLDEIETQYPPGTPRPRLRPPVPLHVELPLLVALAERHNALM